MPSRSLTIFERYSSSNGFWIVCILVASFATVLPIALMGIPDNYDLLQHLRFARTFYGEIQNLSISPGWAAGDNAGFGSVGVRFYPPLAYVVMAATQLITNSWFDSLWTNILLWMFIGSLGVYFWAKEWLPAPQAAMAAVLYAVVPYHLFQVYQGFLFAEFVASAILPFCFLFAGRIVGRGRFIDVILFAIAFSALVLSHIPSTIVGSLSLAVYIAILLERRHFVRSCFGFLAAFAISLAATSFHWVRLVTELEWVKHNSPQFYGTGYYDYSTYFFPMYFNSAEKYIQRLLWAYDITIILTILLFIPLCVLFVSRFLSNRGRANQRHLIALGIVGLVAFFMASAASSFIWNSVGLLQKLQFPWRWLSVASLVGSVVFVIGISEVSKLWPNMKRPIIYGVISIMFAILLYDITQQVMPSAPVSRQELSARIEKIDSEEGCACWWPTWADSRSFQNAERVSAGSRVVEISEWRAENRKFFVAAGNETSARIATFYYPYWKAEVNGTAAEIERADDGTMNIPLPQTKANVRLFFSEPNFVSVAKSISLLAWIGLFLGILVFLRKR